MFDDNRNVRERIDLVRDVKFSGENIINHISSTIMNEQLSLKYFSFHPLMINENNISEINDEPVIIKFFFTDWHDHLPNSKLFTIQ